MGDPNSPLRGDFFCVMRDCRLAVNSVLEATGNEKHWQRRGRWRIWSMGPSWDLNGIVD